MYCSVGGCEFKGDEHVDCTERLMCSMKREIDKFHAQIHEKIGNTFDKILRHQKATNDEFMMKNQEKMKRSEEKLKHHYEHKLKEVKDKCEELKSKLHEKTKECARLEKKNKDSNEKGEQLRSKNLCVDQVIKVVECNTLKRIKKEKDDEMQVRSISSNVQIANVSKGPRHDDGEILKRSRGPAKSNNDNSPNKVRKMAGPSALMKTVEPSKKITQIKLTRLDKAKQAPKTLDGWVTTRKSVHRKSNTNDKLFNFEALKVLPVIEHKTEEDPDISKILKIHEDPDRTLDIVVKKEKVSIDEMSMDNLFEPKHDEAFVEASQDSSVFVIEPEEELPILVEDSGPTCSEKMLQQDKLKLKLKPLDLYETQRSSEKPFVPPRKRKRFYGECHECCEYYDRYAAIEGPTQSELVIWECPNKCKGYRVRKNFAQTIIPARVIITRPDGETPEGFWDLSII